MEKKLKHGSATTYRHHKCRCELCKKAATEKTKQYRQTLNGRHKTREIAKRKRKLEQLALKYVKANHPKVYNRIKKEVL
jgi:hypothetical protein